MTVHQGKDFTLTITGPASSDSLKFKDASEQIVEYLQHMATTWNEQHPYHAQPFIEIKLE